MPERIPTASIEQIDSSRLDMNDTYPGTYGFYVQLDRDPGPEWGLEFETVYEAASYPGKPPVVFEGDRLCVYYLPRYAGDLPRYLGFLRRMMSETNQAVERRNSVLPDEEKEKADFLDRLRNAANTALK